MKPLLIFFLGLSSAQAIPKLPESAKLSLSEDWASGEIDPQKWYPLRKKWGSGNQGVVPENLFIATDTVAGKSQNVLVCRGHGDLYEGPIKGWQGKLDRVGGTLVTKQFFASGRYEVVLKIGSQEKSKNGPERPTHPIGVIPAIWTYSYRWVNLGDGDPEEFSRENPLYNPLMKRQGKKRNTNYYTSEIDFPEFGKKQDLEKGLYNTFLNHKGESLTFPTKSVIDGDYHTITTIWRTALKPFENITDSQVAEFGGFYWVQDKSIPFERYLGNPLKRLGKDKYALYSGTEASHYIDGKHIGTNKKYVPVLAAQLNIGVWFPEWAGAAPWKESSMSIASVKIWEYSDPGDVHGILTEDINDNMDMEGRSVSHKAPRKP